MLQYCESLTNPTISDTAEKLQALWNADDVESDFPPGTIVTDAPEENWLVIGTSDGGERLGKILITCAEAAINIQRSERTLDARGFLTLECATGSPRIFDTTEISLRQRVVDRAAQEVQRRPP